ncbi:hypothetical protein FRC17_006071 [Serendipita sp. 399]|nr:hypothetical protein FRC17_006071 [Serendipita sp. 399]
MSVSPVVLFTLFYDSLLSQSSSVVVSPEQIVLQLPTVAAGEALFGFDSASDFAQQASYLPAQEAGHYPLLQQAGLFPTAKNLATVEPLFTTSPNSSFSNESPLMIQDEAVQIDGGCDYTGTTLAQALAVPFLVGDFLTSAPHIGSFDACNHSSATFDYIPDPTSSALQANMMDLINSLDYRSAVIGERAKVEESILACAFRDDSSHPNQQLHRLLEAILQSQFYRDQQLEPRLFSSEACQLLKNADILELADNAPGRASLYTLFLERQRLLAVCGDIYSTVPLHAQGAWRVRSLTLVLEFI